METKKPTPTEIVETAFAELNARLVQLHQQGDDLFEAGSSSYRPIKLIERYIVSIPPSTANHLYAVSKKIFEKTDWVSLATFLFPGKEEDYYIDDTQKYYKYIDIIEGEEPALKDFFKDLPALIQLKVESGADQVNSTTEKIKLNYSVDDIAALIAILFKTKIIAPDTKTKIYRFVANHFLPKNGKDISFKSLGNRTDTLNPKSLEKWEGILEASQKEITRILIDIRVLKGK